MKSDLKSCSNAGAVDRFIDTAYDNVKKVADNLEELLALQKVISNLQGIYLGTFTSHPATRPDTTALQNGDHYLNTGNNSLYVYLDGGWIYHAIFYNPDDLADAVANSPFYTWYAYADDDSGTGITTDPTGKEYIGIAINRNTPTVSIAAPEVFSWFRAVGSDGSSSYTHFAYADNSDGTSGFNFTTGTYIGVMVSATNVASNDPADYTWNLIKGNDGTSPVKGTDYFDGDAGQYTSFIYRNAETQPATPTGGSFDGTNETYPIDWADDPTIPATDTIKTWVSKAIYREVNGVWQAPTWSAPSLMYQKGDKPTYGVDYTTADGSFNSFIFIIASSQPATPTGGSYDGTNEVFPVGWVDDPLPTSGTDVLWVSKRIYEHDGVSWSPKSAWSEPAMFFKEGIDGITPVKGIDYFDGSDGSFVSFIFRNGSGIVQMPTPTGGTFDGANEVTPVGWTDDPTEPSGTDVTWVSKGRWVHNGTVWQVPTWSTPTIFRERAIDGGDGVDGVDGTDGNTMVGLHIYRRSSGAVPTPSGGSFDFDTRNLTPPTDWSVGIPAGVEPVYVCYGIAAIVGTSGVDNSIPWDNPQLAFENGDVGADGTDGLSVYQAKIFQRSDTPPATPAPNSASYDFGANSLTPPSGWQEGIPAGSDPVYVSEATFSTNGPTGVDNTQTWTTPVLFVSDGLDGTDGLSTFKFYVYQRAATQPTTPTGGSFDFGNNVITAPSGWTDTPPNGTDPLWVSSTLASIVGDTGVDSSLTWSTPTILVQNGIDAVGKEFIYAKHSSTTLPGNPDNAWGFDNPGTASGIVWTDGAPSLDATDQYLFMAQRTIVGTPDYDDPVTDTWSTPTIVGRYGQDGIPGADGSDGIDGLDGLGKEYVFAKYNSATLPSAKRPSNSWGFDNPGTADTLTWYDGAVEIDPIDQYLYRAERTIVGSPAVNDAVSDNWTIPVIVGVFGVDGQDGQDGSDGNDGVRGSRHYYGSATSWSDATADSVITSAGDTKVPRDTVTLSDGPTGFSETRYWNGSSWIVVSEVINGNLVVHGTIGTDQLEAGAVTTDELAADAVRAKHVLISSTGNEAGNLSGVQMEFNPFSDSPIAIRDKDTDTTIFAVQLIDGEPKAVVVGNGGEGFINNPTAITEEVKKAINQYYEGAAYSANSGTGSMSSGSTSNFTVTTSTSGKIEISFKLAASAYYNGLSNQNYTKPVWQVRVRRDSAAGAILYSKTYTGAAYNIFDNPIGWECFSSLTIDDGFVDEAAPISSSEVYYLEVIRSSGTPTTISRNLFQGEAPGFLENTFSDATAGYWVDKDTDMMIQWGSQSIPVGANNIVSLPTSYSSAVHQAYGMCYGISSTGDQFQLRARKRNNSSIYIENSNAVPVTAVWMTIGR